MANYAFISTISPLEAGIKPDTKFIVDSREDGINYVSRRVDFSVMTDQIAVDVGIQSILNRMTTAEGQITEAIANHEILDTYTHTEIDRINGRFDTIENLDEALRVAAELAESDFVQRVETLEAASRLITDRVSTVEGRLNVVEPTIAQQRVDINVISGDLDTLEEAVDVIDESLNGANGAQERLGILSSNYARLTTTNSELTANVFQTRNIFQGSNPTGGTGISVKNAGSDTANSKTGIAFLDKSNSEKGYIKTTFESASKYTLAVGIDDGTAQAALTFTKDGSNADVTVKQPNNTTGTASRQVATTGWANNAGSGVNNIVHKSGNETINGIKTFKDDVTISGMLNNKEFTELSGDVITAQSDILTNTGNIGSLSTVCDTLSNHIYNIEHSATYNANAFISSDYTRNRDYRFAWNEENDNLELWNDLQHLKLATTNLASINNPIVSAYIVKERRLDEETGGDYPYWSAFLNLKFKNGEIVTTSLSGVYGTQANTTYNGKRYELSVTPDGLNFYIPDNTVKAFIHDGMLSSVSLSTVTSGAKKGTYLHLVWNSDGNNIIDFPVSGLIDNDWNEGDYINVDNYKIKLRDLNTAKITQLSSFTQTSTSGKTSYTQIATGSTMSLNAALAQLDVGIASLSNGAYSNNLRTDLTASRVAISNGSGKLAVSDITTTELNYLDNLSVNVQSTINSHNNSITNINNSINTINNHISNIASVSAQWNTVYTWYTSVSAIINTLTPLTGYVSQLTGLVSDGSTFIITE